MFTAFRSTILTTFHDVKFNSISETISDSRRVVVFGHEFRFKEA
jgi:hypothetical protein